MPTALGHRSPEGTARRLHGVVGDAATGGRSGRATRSSSAGDPDPPRGVPSASARNLAYYLALRHHDLPRAPGRAHASGLSSLGRCEARVHADAGRGARRLTRMRPRHHERRRRPIRRTSSRATSCSAPRPRRCSAPRVDHRAVAGDGDDAELRRRSSLRPGSQPRFLRYGRRPGSTAPRRRGDLDGDRDPRPPGRRPRPAVRAGSASTSVGRVRGSPRRRSRTRIGSTATSGSLMTSRPVPVESRMGGPVPVLARPTRSPSSMRGRRGLGQRRTTRCDRRAEGRRRPAPPGDRRAREGGAPPASTRASTSRRPSSASIR